MPTPTPSRLLRFGWLPWTLLLIPLLLPLLMSNGVACRADESAGGGPRAVDPVADRLNRLTFDSMVSLGSHHMIGTLALTEASSSRNFTSKETYELKWEGWHRYAYRITKDERPTLDVMILGGAAYQVRPDGMARERPNVHDFHYYLQQTWNLWATAARPFGDALGMSALERGTEAGRPATQYAVSLRGPHPGSEEAGGTGALRTELVAADGRVWIDDATGVPLTATFNGVYKTIRASRVPGRPDAETRHTITLELSRDGLGSDQQLDAPEVAPAPVAQPSRGDAGLFPRRDAEGRQNPR